MRVCLPSRRPRRRRAPGAVSLAPGGTALRFRAARALRSLATRFDRPAVLVGSRGHCQGCGFDWVGGHVCMAPYRAAGE